MPSRSVFRARSAHDAQPSEPEEVREIPIGLRRAAAWSWRLLLVIALAALIVYGLSKVASIVIAVLVAILLASLLSPAVVFLTRKTFMGRTLATVVVLLAVTVVVLGGITLAGSQLVTQFGDIYQQALTGFQQLTDWATQTLGIDSSTINTYVQEGLTRLQANAGTILSGAMSGVSTVGSVLTGAVIAIFTLFFLLQGGRGIWIWIVRLLPPVAREATHESFRRGWKALSAYTRTQVLVAAVDAFGIAIGIACLGLGGYAVPIWLIVFFSSFIPIVGAVVSGAVAVLIVLVLKSWVLAIVMLGIVLAVQQIESNLLQPLLMGKAVELHPLAVFLGVAVGTMVAGIAGALLAIPLIAFVNATVVYLTRKDPSPELGRDDAAAKAYAPVVRTSRRA